MEESVSPRVQYNQITKTSEQYFEFYHVFGCCQDEFSSSMLTEKKKAQKKSFFLKKIFFTNSEISKIGQFKHISSSQVESGRACISSIRIIYLIKPLTKIHSLLRIMI